MAARTMVRTGDTARNSRSAARSRTAVSRYGGATKYSVSKTATQSATAIRSTATTPAGRPVSGEANGRVLSLERGSDLLQAGAGRIALGRSERMAAEARKLEQAGQTIDRRARNLPAPQRLSHELVRRLPRRPRHTGARRDPLESPVAPDDRRARVGRTREIVQTVLDRCAQRLRRCD